MGCPMTILMMLLTIQQVCEALSISHWTLANWRREGFGPPWLRLKGNDIRYPAGGALPMTGCTD